MGRAPGQSISTHTADPVARADRPSRRPGPSDDRPITADDCSPWWVLHTKPRQEKAVAEAFAAAGLRHFLPTVRETRIYGHRRRIVDRPLFASYVFFCGQREEAWFADGARRLAGVIEVADQRTLARELEQIRLAVRGMGVLEPYPFLTTGRAVRVRTGPFKGVEGVVDGRAGPARIVLRIAALGRAVSLEIDAGLLEPLD